MRKSLTDDDVNFSEGKQEAREQTHERDLEILDDSELNMSQQ